MLVVVVKCLLCGMYEFWCINGVTDNVVVLLLAFLSYYNFG
jgi:hypothetical protein